jgi:hypothetical protein
MGVQEEMTHRRVGGGWRQKVEKGLLRYSREGHRAEETSGRGGFHGEESFVVGDFGERSLADLTWRESSAVGPCWESELRV